MTRFVAGMFTVGLIVPDVGVAFGQDYPNKPIRIVTAGAGSSTDFTARIIAQGISSPLGQPVIVENRISIIATETVAKAVPDGYTVLVTAGVFWIAPLLQKMSYDPVRDFVAITFPNRQPNILTVHPSVPVYSVKELVAFAKARPGALNYASGGAGSSSHLAAELFSSMAGVHMVRIPYDGTAPGVTALLSGQVQVIFAANPSLTSNARAGKLRALAVTSLQPSALFPELPTVAATLPGYESVAVTCVFAPAKTPEAIIKRLNQEIVRVLSTPEAKERFLGDGTEVIANSPVEAAATIKSDMTRIGKLIKDIGIRAE